MILTNYFKTLWKDRKPSKNEGIVVAGLGLGVLLESASKNGKVNIN